MALNNLHLLNSSIYNFLIIFKIIVQNKNTYIVFTIRVFLLEVIYMGKKLVMNTDVIQKFKWGGTNLEWSEEADKLSNQLETMEYLNNALTDEQKEEIMHSDK